MDGIKFTVRKGREYATYDGKTVAMYYAGARSQKYERLLRKYNKDQKESKKQLKDVIYTEVWDTKAKQNQFQVLDVIKEQKIRGDFKILLYKDGKLLRTLNVENLQANIKAINKWWNPRNDIGAWSRFGTTNESIAEMEGLDSEYRLVITRSKKPAPKKLSQSFADGVQHCFFTPIKAHYEAMMAGATPKKAKEYNSLLDKIDYFTGKYAVGIPENDIEGVCKVLGIRAMVCDLFKEQKTYYNSGATKSKQFLFVNSRQNHVDCVADLYDMTDAKIVSQEIINSMLNEAIAKNTPFMILGKLEHVNMLILPDGAYKAMNEISEAFDSFDELIGIKELKLTEKNHIQYAKHGYLMTTHAKFNDVGDDEVFECDMKKAYTQFKSNPFYCGFPSKFSVACRFDKVDVMEVLSKAIGMFRVCNVSLAGCDVNTRAILMKLGVHTIHSVLPSVELEFLWSIGVRFDLVSGLFCYKDNAFHFEFSKEMLDKKLYTHWSGKLAMDVKNTVYTFIGTNEFAGNLAYQYGDKRVRTTPIMGVDYDDGWSNYNKNVFIEFSKPKEKVISYHHIAGFITSYTRISVITELLNFNVDNLIGVKLDSIVFTGANKIKSELFVSKDPKVDINWCESWYADDSMVIDDSWITAKYVDRISGNTVKLGQGGSGKTHEELINKMYLNPIYVAPSWCLALDKYTEYGVKVQTIHQMIGVNCEAYHIRFGSPAVMFIDEITMICVDWLEKLSEMYPYTLLILMGDYTRNGLRHQIKPVQESRNVKSFLNKFRILENTEDYRSKDSRLKEVKLLMRQKVEKTQDVAEVNAYGANLMADRIISRAEAVEMMTCNDWVLSSKHNDCDWWLENCPKNIRYYCERKNSGLVIHKRFAGESIPVNGEILSEKIDETCVPRVAFTIHSFQGKTIPETDKLFIVMNDMFDYAMFYTAISRVRVYEQIYLVR